MVEDLIGIVGKTNAMLFKTNKQVAETNQRLAAFECQHRLSIDPGESVIN